LAANFWGYGYEISKVILLTETYDGDRRCHHGRFADRRTRRCRFAICASREEEAFGISKEAQGQADGCSD
jgi:hypothetical protein